MNLLQYNNKRVRVIDIDGKEYVGMAYYEDAINFDEKEDSLTIKLDDDKNIHTLVYMNQKSNQ